jgi:DNA-binding beta-propeller fold protein YncE
MTMVLHGRRFLLAVIALVGLVAAPFAGSGQAAGSGPSYHLAKKLPIDGTATYYDYQFVDEAARRLYVSFGGDVVVFDVDRLTPVGRLSGGKKVHGIAAAAGRLYVTDGETDLVRVFDAKGQKPVGEVKAGKNPDAILYDPGSRKVFAFNNHGKSATVFDPNSLVVAATIDLGGAAEFARSDSKGAVWVNLEDKSEVVRIDTRTATVSARHPLAPCQEPTGMGFDAKHRRLFIGCNNQMMAVLDADSGHVVTTLPIGPGVDATDFDPATGNIFNSCGGGDGSLVVIHQDSADKYHVLDVIPTQKRAKTLVLDKPTHRVFVTAASFGTTPSPTAEQPRPRAPIVPGSFAVWVFEPK